MALLFFLLFAAALALAVILLPTTMLPLELVFNKPATLGLLVVCVGLTVLPATDGVLYGIQADSKTKKNYQNLSIETMLAQNNEQKDIESDRFLLRNN